jgi:hypothetical protein
MSQTQTHETEPSDLHARLDRLDAQLAKMTTILGRVTELVEAGIEEQQWFTTTEAAELLGKAEFTVREWCRLGRINADKKPSGRGPAGEWTISRNELTRIRNEGLLPDPRAYRHVK